MTDQAEHDQTEDAARLRRLAEDWLALWQDELTAVMRDPETMRGWQALLGVWARMAASMMRVDPAAPGPAGSQADDPPRTAPVAAAPDPRDAEVERLRGQLLQLESRVAELERTGRAGRAGGRRTTRRVSPRGPA